MTYISTYIFILFLSQLNPFPRLNDTVACTSGKQFPWKTENLLKENVGKSHQQPQPNPTMCHSTLHSMSECPAQKESG